MLSAAPEGNSAHGVSALIRECWSMGIPMSSQICLARVIELKRSEGRQSDALCTVRKWLRDLML